MKDEDGDKRFAIWLLGDSNPKNWQHVLDVPFDPKHPARHSIWTPVLETIQEYVFVTRKNRVKTSPIYVRNAIEDPVDKPLPNSLNWSENVEKKALSFRDDVLRYKPKVILSFGAFAFEFARRALTPEKDKHPYKYWDTKNLGNEFRRNINDFNISETNILPLLHTSISRGRFIESHRYFCNGESNNYFEYVGRCIGQKLTEYYDDLPIWML